jgi:hypothetical protein
VLVRDDGVCIGQAAHAWVSGQLAAAWDRTEVPHRDAAVLAATQHDIGMAEWDLAPELDAERGLPVSFMRMDLHTHLRLWSAAPSKVLTQSRVAALMLSLHGTSLYSRRDLTRLSEADAGAVRAYLAEQRAIQAALRADTGVSEEEAARLQALLFAWDWLSLALCLDWAPDTLTDGPIGLALSGDLSLDPWPFGAAATVTVVTEGRRLDDRSSTTAAELHAALEAAERVELSWTLTRAPSGAP